MFGFGAPKTQPLSVAKAEYKKAQLLEESQNWQFIAVDNEKKGRLGAAKQAWKQAIALDEQAAEYDNAL
jgi:hypothetical protein